ncbi:hypothetical protein [Granulicella arctica]|uniref:Putative oxidoreductase n=1 Tax=Granulicella arctica TaxID=940613 RepID=A0A7Y9PJL0_9BACT|nr:putative oxidoreductase [Granulicella arctica]
MHNVITITGFVASLNIPVPAVNAHFIARLEFFSDPGKFYVADPYTFLFGSLIVLVFGAGLFSIDALSAKRIQERA